MEETEKSKLCGQKEADVFDKQNEGYDGWI